MALPLFLELQQEMMENQNYVETVSETYQTPKGMVKALEQSGETELLNAVKDLYTGEAHLRLTIDEKVYEESAEKIRKAAETLTKMENIKKIKDICDQNEVLKEEFTKYLQKEKTKYAWSNMARAFYQIINGK